MTNEDGYIVADKYTKIDRKAKETRNTVECAIHDSCFYGTACNSSTEAQ
jgi:hypothetical protein